jgi:hypothetical protein
MHLNLYRKHEEITKLAHPRKNLIALQKEIDRTLIDYICLEVRRAWGMHDGSVPEELKHISEKPSWTVIRPPGFLVNGFRYHTRTRDAGRVNQNSGVSIIADTAQVASSKDNNPAYGPMVWYGVIEEIWLLTYNSYKVPLFKCKWVDDRAVKTDDLGFTSVDLSRAKWTDEPFILAHHARQIFYVQDQIEPTLSIVMYAPPREWNEDVEEDTEDTFNDHSPSPRPIPILDENFVECEIRQHEVPGEEDWVD